MKTLLELEPGDCRFPFGDEDFTFCGAQKHMHLVGDKLVQSSYCKQHHLICIAVPHVRKAAA